MEDNKKYEYKYWYSFLGDGGFNKSDHELGVMLKDGWKPLRETPISKDGWVLFVLSRQLPDGV